MVVNSGEMGEAVSLSGNSLFLPLMDLWFYEAVYIRIRLYLGWVVWNTCRCSGSIAWNLFYGLWVCEAVYIRLRFTLGMTVRSTWDTWWCSGFIGRKSVFVDGVLVLVELVSCFHREVL